MKKKSVILSFMLIVTMTILMVACDTGNGGSGDSGGCNSTDPTPTPDPGTDPGTDPGQANVTTTFQAENAVVVSGAVETEHSGYTGSGYVNTDNAAGSYIEFSLTAPQADAYELTFYYAAESGNRYGSIQVNGSTVVANIDFNGTGSWTTWGTASATVNLNAGDNTIRLRAEQSGGLANIDKMDVYGYAVTEGAPPDSPDPPASYDVVVASDGSGNYRTVQAAINAAPGSRTSWYTIYIKNGKYREVVTVDKPYLQLIGQSADATVITYDNYASRVGSTSGSATAFFKAKNFIARNITFENSFDYPNSSAANKQAVAAEPMADRQVFVNCRFTGYQDTLYVRSGRSYFKDCYISGNTDFIFGDGTAVFDNCDIYSRPKNGGCISAPSTLASTAYGLIFLNCNVTGPSTGVWLGRPWHPSSSTTSIKSNAVYLNCYLGSHIATNGWTSMSGVYPATERLWEYKNSGPGAQVNSSRTQLSASQAAGYTVSNILRGSDNWNPESLAGSAN